MNWIDEAQVWREQADTLRRERDEARADLATQSRLLEQVSAEIEELRRQVRLLGGRCDLMRRELAMRGSTHAGDVSL